MRGREFQPTRLQLRLHVRRAVQMRADAFDVAKTRRSDDVEYRVKVVQRPQRVKLDRQDICYRHGHLPTSGSHRRAPLVASNRFRRWSGNKMRKRSPGVSLVSAGSRIDNGRSPRRVQANKSLPMGSLISTETSCASPASDAIMTCSGRMPSSTGAASTGVLTNG